MKLTWGKFNFSLSLHCHEEWQRLSSTKCRRFLLSPWACDLFAKEKEPLRGNRCKTWDELIRIIRRSIQNINKDGRSDGVRRLPNIWQKEINKGEASILKVHKCCTQVNKASQKYRTVAITFYPTLVYYLAKFITRAWTWLLFIAAATIQVVCTRDKPIVWRHCTCKTGGMSVSPPPLTHQAQVSYERRQWYPRSGGNLLWQDIIIWFENVNSIKSISLGWNSF